jgi:translocation and assembly module TamB
VRLDDVLLRLGEVRWTSAQPGTVRWGGDAVEVRSLELRDGAGGRVFADGRLPSAGTATGDLQLAVERLQIGGFAALLQDTMQTAGLLSLQARITGTQAAPRIRGDAALVDAEYGGTALPALHTDFSYADAELQARAELRGETPAPLLTAEARVPVNLALSGVEGERLLNRPFSVDVRADSLPLESLPSFTEAVSDVRGRLRGTVSVRGTPQAPEIDGAIDLDLASLALVQPGVRLRDLAGGVRIRNDSVLVDSLVALSDGGPIRLSGVLDISTPAEPGFALVLAARDARVLDNEMGRLRADADLAIDGPFDAVRVTGDVHLREGVIRPPATDPRVIDLDDPRISALIASSGIAPEGLGEGNALVDNLRVEVGVRIARNTWVRTPEANVEIHTPEETGALALRMARGEQTLALEGTVVTDRGEYEFSGRRFELSHGSVTFLGTPEINPLLQITAEHEVPQRGREALAIQINVAGTLQEPRITLESNAQPPLSQSDLLSYLAFGRSSSALLQQGGSGLDQEGGGGSGNVGALATQKLTAVALGALVNDAVTDLERGGAREFGLDVFRISPTDLPSELRLDGASNLLRGTELEAGRYLTSRWFVAGQGRATALPGVRVEYRTPAGFRWMTTWEPRYQPAEPSFSTADEVVAQRRVLGTFLFWEWRY